MNVHPVVAPSFLSVVAVLTGGGRARDMEVDIAGRATVVSRAPRAAAAARGAAALGEDQREVMLHVPLGSMACGRRAQLGCMLNPHGGQL